MSSKYLQSLKKLNEGSRAGDLDFLVSNKIHFDEYNSKMGRPEAITTASFLIKQREPALDFVSFLENGYDWILDADISSGEVKENQYLVFVEMQRMHDITEKVSGLLADIQHLTNIKPGGWQVKWYKDENYVPFDKNNFSETVPNTPKMYKEMIESYNQFKEQAKDLNSDISTLKKLSGIS